MDASKPLPVSVIIPAYNEELGIEQVVRRMGAAFKNAGWTPEKDFEIIVVDDGSTDKTASLAQNAGARVISHPANRGYGRSLVTGFDQARHDWVLMIDGDESYPPEEALKLIPYAPRFDMVVGARHGSFYWGTLSHAFLRWIYLTLAGFVAGEKIPDANSGLRLVRKSAFYESMPILCYGYSFTTTMTLSFIHSGHFVQFVPAVYTKRKGSSKVRGFRDIPRTLQIMTQVILYYNPLKFLVVLALIPASLAIVFGLGWLCRHSSLYAALSCMNLLAALFVFLIGCILDSMRMGKGVVRRP